MIVDRAYNIQRFFVNTHIHAIEMAAWHFLRFYLNKRLPVYYKKHPVMSGKPCSGWTEKEVIISLTTFPDRMDTLPIVLETLFRQTVKPTKIQLWLADEQYPNKQAVDCQLRQYIDMGLEIQYCDDIKSHKKYFYAMLNHPDAIVVTVDDDIIYSETMLEKLLTIHKEHPTSIVAHRAHLMLKEHGVLLPYNNWKHCVKDCLELDLYLCPTGCAGCLYPPHSLSEHVFDKDVLKQICFYADDLWLKAMEYLHGTQVVLTAKDNPEVFTIMGSDENGLAKQNVQHSKNDEQIKAVTSYYNIKW